jgi:hypothetical protein
MNDLYDTDLLQWSEHQGALLRRRAADELIDEAELDWPHVADEIGALGKSERSALVSHIATIVEHLAKLETSPAIEPRIGWQETVPRARADVTDIPENSPSVRPTLGEVVARQHAWALRLVAGSLSLHGETARQTLDQIQYCTDRVLGTWFQAV